MSPRTRMNFENSMPVLSFASEYGLPSPLRSHTSTSRFCVLPSPMIVSSIRQQLSLRIEKTQSRCMRSWFWSSSSRTTASREQPSRSLCISCFAAA
jgi:hypothetical protein